MDELQHLNLETYIKFNYTNTESIKNILYKIKEKLLFFHQQEIYLCDIKPNNIMIGRNNEIIFLDVDGWMIDEILPEISIPDEYQKRGCKYGQTYDCLLFNKMVNDVKGKVGGSYIYNLFGFSNIKFRACELKNQKPHQK